MPYEIEGWFAIPFFAFLFTAALSTTVLYFVSNRLIMVEKSGYELMFMFFFMFTLTAEELHLNENDTNLFHRGKAAYKCLLVCMAGAFLMVIISSILKP